VLTRFTCCVRSAERLYETVQIVLVGKYISLQDSYMSVVKALEHASMRCGRKLELKVRLLPPLFAFATSWLSLALLLSAIVGRLIVSRARCSTFGPRKVPRRLGSRLFRKVSLAGCRVRPSLRSITRLI